MGEIPDIFGSTFPIGRAAWLAIALAQNLPDGVRLPNAVIWTAGVVAGAAVAWIALRRSRWGVAVGWLALALAGQACALQLLSVGPEIKLQLFHEWRTLVGSYRAIFLAAVGLQAALVVWGARGLWPKLESHGRQLVSWPQGLLFLALTAYSAITIAPQVAQALVEGGFVGQAARQASKVGLALFLYGVGGLNLLLAAAAIPAQACERLKSRWQQSGRARLAWWCALWVVGVSSLLAWGVLERMPHVPDEVAYLFHAKYLATGRLYLEPPPDVEAFWCRFSLLDGDKWYVVPPGGWAAVLALGVLAGVPWLVNPLLGGTAILLAHALVRRLYNREVADFTVLLLAASPWLLFMSASLMMHPATLVFALLGLLGVRHARETGSPGWAAAAGFGVGGVLHVRPLDALILAAVAGVWWLGAGWKRLRPAAMAMTLATGLAMAGLFLAYNRSLTGDATYVPLNKYLDRNFYPGGNRLGFGPEVGNFGWVGMDALPGHGPLDVFMNTNHNLYMENFELFGWACGSLLFVFLLLARGRLRSDALMWGLVFGVAAGMSLYWYSGVPDFGARYWYLTLVPLAVLTVRGAQALVARLSQTGAAAAAGRVWVFVILASLLGLVNLLPWRSLDKYPNYRGLRADIRKLQRDYQFGRSLVLVRGPRSPDYPSAFIFNPPRFDRDAPGPLYARDVSPEVTERLIRYYSDRPIWILAGPSVTGDGFRVLEGPLPPRGLTKSGGQGGGSPER